MHSFLSKLAMLGVVAGGFFVTGDLSGLLERGRSITERTAVPDAVESEPAPAVPPSAPTPPAASPALPEPAGQTEAVARIPMPAMSLQSLDMSSLPPGTRVLLLCGRQVVALDLVDGSAGEVLEHTHAINSDRTVTIASTAAPRRLVVLGSTAAARDGWRLVGGPTPKITRGEWLHLVPSGGRASTSSPQSIGPIEALGIE
jgi:hypothetical protein